jgi:hypothetical protein
MAKFNLSNIAALNTLYQDGIDFSIRQHYRVGLHTAAAAIGNDQRKIFQSYPVTIESRQLKLLAPLA